MTIDIMEKVEILKMLKDKWQSLKINQTEINALEKALKTKDPTTELTVWDNTRRETDNPGKEYTELDPANAKILERKIINLCEKRNLIEQIVKDKFPEYNSPVGVGQLLNLLESNK